jgi:simple sugar transport system substrate-binding protein/rhamnose transport system substrate-binding protein
MILYCFMEDNMKKILFIGLIALLALGGAVFAKGGTQAASDVPDIVVMPKLMGIPYFNAAQEGVEKAARELGVKAVFTGPATADAAEQAKMIDDLVQRGVKVIAVAPNDAAALVPSLRKARDAGVIVMDWDTSLDQSLVSLSVHQIDDKVYGEHLWDLLAQGMGGEGEYAILTGGLSASTLNAWIDFGTAYAKTKYPGLKLVGGDRNPTDEQAQIAYRKTLDLLTTYPDLKGIMCISSPTAAAAGQAIDEKGLNGKVTAVGTALPSDVGPWMEKKAVYGDSLWDPGKLGYLTVYLAKDLLAKKTPKDGDNVPGVGVINVKPDGKTVIMGPPQDFTVENYKQYKF